MKEKGPCAEQKAELLFCLLRSSCCQDKKLTPRQCLEPGNFPSECALARRAFHLCCLQPVCVHIVSNYGLEMAVAFVTVGTTSFDELINQVNTVEFHEGLLRLGYKDLVIQYGNGSVVPRVAEDIYAENAFRYKDSLIDEFQKASLVISHGGAGTCIQALTPYGCRRLIVVINDALMDNHQEELAVALLQGKHALICTPPSLNHLLWTGSQSTYHSPFSYSENVSLAELKKFLGPEIPPEQAGFVGFTHGYPEKLLSYLEERLLTFT
ncbi:bifunctional UDP-N-acetylglucosamine transferase and deubiquitinase ALG13 [Schistosoma japonicum]|nr:bifunctional UDP-N-acetylglucosamine transferase and deubiquitinase ALG13 [Schistosoma japonicum]